MLSSPPSSERARPMPSPAAQVFERVDDGDHVRAASLAAGALGHLGEAGAARGQPRRLQHDVAEPETDVVRVDQVDVHGRAERLARDGGRVERPGHARGDVDADDLVRAGGELLVDLAEALDRGLARARQAGERGHPFVEAVRVDLHAVEQRLVVEQQR